MWRQQVKLRLEAAVEEILSIFERTAADYEEELTRLKRNGTSDAAFSPKDHQNILVSPANNQQKVLTEEQRPGVDQQDPKLLHIKQEEELWTILEQEELNGRKETDTTGFPFTAAPLKREDDEGISLFSQLHQQQKEARDLPSSISADQMVAAAAGGEDSGRAETKDNPSSSETAVSEEDEEDNNVSNLDFQLKQLPDSGPKIEDNDSDWTESKSPRCSECSELFVNNRSHHRINSSTCLVKMKGDAVKNDIDSLRNIQTNLKSFSCHNCGKTCTSKTALNTHRVKHKGGVNCELCGHRFRNKKLLNRHKRVHTGYKKYICDVCGHRFSNKSHLDMHTRSHTGEKPFACNLCELKFSRNTHLNRHMKIHTGEKQFACDVCEQRFIRKDYLDRHMRAKKAKLSCAMALQV